MKPTNKCSTSAQVEQDPTMEMREAEMGRREAEMEIREAEMERRGAEIEMREEHGSNLFNFIRMISAKDLYDSSSSQVVSSSKKIPISSIFCWSNEDSTDHQFGMHHPPLPEQLLFF